MGIDPKLVEALRARVAERKSSVLKVASNPDKTENNIRKYRQRYLDVRSSIPEQQPERPLDKPIVILIEPIGAPRQSRRDKWNPAPSVVRYRVWKDAMKKAVAEAGWTLGPVLDVEFRFGIPDRWSRKKKAAMLGRPHQQRPDVDNCCKAIMDLEGKEDGYVHTIRARKVWAEGGSIVVNQ